MRYRIIAFFILLYLNSFSQSNPLKYSLDFLELNTNARINGFGDVGVVGSAFYKNGGLFQNPGIFSEQYKTSAIDYTYKDVTGVDLGDATYSGFALYYSIDSLNGLGLSYGRKNIGNIDITDEYGVYQGTEEYYDYFLKLSYAHSFGRSISLGAAIKYIKSRAPSSDRIVVTDDLFALDLGLHYRKKYNFKEYHYIYTGFGIVLDNLGPKISYTYPEKEFIPTKLAAGLFINSSFRLSRLFQLNIELGYQAEKYLVPTPPLYDENGNIISGYDPDITSFNALYQSFYDAPHGFSEEIHEIIHKFGNEIRLGITNKYYIAFRHGRQIEHETKGNRNYQTFGYGIGIYGFTLDYMEIMAESNSVLDSLWAISLGLNINLGKNVINFKSFFDK